MSAGGAGPEDAGEQAALLPIVLPDGSVVYPGRRGAGGLGGGSGEPAGEEGGEGEGASSEERDLADGEEASPLAHPEAFGSDAALRRAISYYCTRLVNEPGSKPFLRDLAGLLADVDLVRQMQTRLGLSVTPGGDEAAVLGRAGAKGARGGHGAQAGLEALSPAALRRLQAQVAGGEVFLSRVSEALVDTSVGLLLQSTEARGQMAELVRAREAGEGQRRENTVAMAFQGQDEALAEIRREIAQDRAGYATLDYVRALSAQLARRRFRVSSGAALELFNGLKITEGILELNPQSGVTVKHYLAKLKRFQIQHEAQSGSLGFKAGPDAGRPRKHGAVPSFASAADGKHTLHSSQVHTKKQRALARELRALREEVGRESVEATRNQVIAVHSATLSQLFVLFTRILRKEYARAPALLAPVMRGCDVYQRYLSRVYLDDLRGVVRNMLVSSVASLPEAALGARIRVLEQAFQCAHEARRPGPGRGAGGGRGSARGGRGGARGGAKNGDTHAHLPHPQPGIEPETPFGTERNRPFSLAREVAEVRALAERNRVAGDPYSAERYVLPLEAGVAGCLMLARFQAENALSAARGLFLPVDPVAVFAYCGVFLLDVGDPDGLAASAGAGPGGASGPAGAAGRAPPGPPPAKLYADIARALQYCLVISGDQNHRVEGCRGLLRVIEAVCTDPGLAETLESVRATIDRTFGPEPEDE